MLQAVDAADSGGAATSSQPGGQDGAVAVATAPPLAGKNSAQEQQQQQPQHDHRTRADSNASTASTAAATATALIESEGEAFALQIQMEEVDEDSSAAAGGWPTPTPLPPLPASRGALGVGPRGAASPRSPTEASSDDSNRNRKSAVCEWCKLQRKKSKARSKTGFAGKQQALNRLVASASSRERERTQSSEDVTFGLDIEDAKPLTRSDVLSRKIASAPVALYTMDDSPKNNTKTPVMRPQGVRCANCQRQMPQSPASTPELQERRQYSRAQSIPNVAQGSELSRVVNNDEVPLSMAIRRTQSFPARVEASCFAAFGGSREQCRMQ
mmetsp:Transcript_6157/g.13655  ORF Transcript_6157/g.13655 Transcript_6157/m.13655 type:complete len:327 (-) Transcript_6157:266-1246(-)